MYLSSSEDTTASFVDPNSKRLFYGEQRLILSGQRRRAKHPYSSCGDSWLTVPQTVFPFKLAVTSCHIHGSNSQDILWSFCNTTSKSFAYNKQWSVRSTKDTQQMLGEAIPFLPKSVTPAKHKMKVLHQCQCLPCNTPWRRSWCVLKQLAYGMSTLQPCWAASLNYQTSPRY